MCFTGQIPRVRHDFLGVETVEIEIWDEYNKVEQDKTTEIYVKVYIYTYIYIIYKVIMQNTCIYIYTYAQTFSSHQFMSIWEGKQLFEAPCQKSPPRGEPSFPYQNNI